MCPNVDGNDKAQLELRRRSKRIILGASYREFLQAAAKFHANWTHSFVIVLLRF